MSDENAFFVFNETSEIEFKELYGLTFVFTKNTIKINGKIAAAEIYPSGIIYRENGEFYFAATYKVKSVDMIVEEYVKRHCDTI